MKEIKNMEIIDLLGDGDFRSHETVSATPGEWQSITGEYRPVGGEWKPATLDILWNSDGISFEECCCVIED